MIKRWFIGVKAASSGFFTGFNNYYSDSCTELTAKPSFTKQTALAKSYTTSDEAEKAIVGFLDQPTEYITKSEQFISDVEAVVKVWDTISFEEKCQFLKKHEISVYAGTTKSWNGREIDNFINLHYHSHRNTSDLKESEVAAINNMQFDTVLTKTKNRMEFYQNRIEFIKTKLVIREHELELKFKDSEKQKLQWEIRGDDDTSRGYCNCCGGAIPSIPQLRIGYHTRICAICMGKLAQEALIQSGKIDPDIMEHYDADRFLRGV